MSDVTTLTEHSSSQHILINMYIQHKYEENHECRKFTISDTDFGASKLNLEKGKTLKQGTLMTSPLNFKPIIIQHSGYFVIIAEFNDRFTVETSV